MPSIVSIIMQVNINASCLYFMSFLSKCGRRQMSQANAQQKADHRYSILNHSLHYLRKPNGLGFLKSQFRFSSSHLAPPQVDPREPIYRLVAIFENWICLRFYRYTFIR